MVQRVRMVSIAIVAVLAIVLSGCGSGTSASSSDDESAPTRQASAREDVELCIAVGHLQPGEPEMSVVFMDFPPPDGDRRTYDPVSLDMDRCLTGPGAIQAQVEGRSIYVSVLSGQSVTDPPWNISITCDDGTPQRMRYRTVMDMFDTYKTSKLCSGKTVEAYRKANSGSTVEFNVNIGF